MDPSQFYYDLETDIETHRSLPEKWLDLHVLQDTEVRINGSYLADNIFKSISINTIE